MADVVRESAGPAKRRRVAIAYLDDTVRRRTTFSKRKSGLMKKAYELSVLTGTQVLVITQTENGRVCTFATDKMQPFITSPVGRGLLLSCLQTAPNTR